MILLIADTQKASPLKTSRIPGFSADSMCQRIGLVNAYCSTSALSITRPESISTEIGWEVTEGDLLVSPWISLARSLLEDCMICECRKSFGQSAADSL